MSFGDLSNKEQASVERYWEDFLESLKENLKEFVKRPVS